MSHFDAIVEVARRLDGNQGRPRVEFWLPTKEHGVIQDWIDANGYRRLPDNLTIRLSAWDIGDTLNVRQPYLTSSSIDSEQGNLCPVTYDPEHKKRYGANCGRCRDCWDKSVKNVDYKFHPETSKKRITPDEPLYKRAPDVRAQLRSPWERPRGKKLFVPGAEFEGESLMKNETTYAGLIEAAFNGDISTRELLRGMEQGAKISEQDAADVAMDSWKSQADKGKLPTKGMRKKPMGMDKKKGCPTPGEKKRSRGRGRGLARGNGLGPIGAMAGESAIGLKSFESLVAEGCGMKPKKKKAKKKAKKKIKASESLKRRPRRRSTVLEFAAPERQDVIRWARGANPKRVGEGKTPFWFRGDDMISQNVVIAKRNLGEKKAQVVHAKNLSAYTGRHAVLANQGLHYAGYTVEVVDKL